MSQPVIMLVDNGSSRPQSTLQLRRIATSLAQASGREIHPVSLQHAHKVPADAFHGRPADTLASFLEQRAASGDREFVLVPLLFGKSRALTRFVPDQVAQIQAQFKDVHLRQAAELCPLPAGEPRLARILCDNLGGHGEQVILVDHGSPIPQVSAVRHRLAEQMQDCLGEPTGLSQAVMERREGAEYDFNGDLLETRLRRLARDNPAADIALSLLFMLPGRHAGAGGDIQEICDQVRQDYPELRIHISPLVGEHPGLTEILVERLEQAL